MGIRNATLYLWRRSKACHRRASELQANTGQPLDELLYIYDDHGGVQTPESYTVQFFDGTLWRDVKNLVKTPAQPAGSALNTATFAPVTTNKIRIVFTHHGNARSGLTELELRND